MQLIQLINYLLSYFLATYFVHLHKLTTVNITFGLVFFIRVLRRNSKLIIVNCNCSYFDFVGLTIQLDIQFNSKPSNTLKRGSFNSSYFIETFLTSLFLLTFT